MAAFGQVAEQQLLGQRTLDVLLNHAGHWAGAHGLVVALLRNPLPSRGLELDSNVVLVELRLELEDQLVDDAGNGTFVQRLELDDRIQAITELGREDLLDDLHGVGGVILHRKPDRGATHFLSAGIRRHDDRHVAKVRLAPVVVGQCAVVHDLQQQVENLRMRLLDLIEQQDTVRIFRNRLGQQPALIEADVARRRTDQPRNRMPLHILGHVETHELDTHGHRELPGNFRLADTRGPGEQK